MKLYADEAGAGAVRDLDSLVVSALARVEVPAALWRKHRLGELSASDTAVLVEEFEWDWLGEGEAGPRFAVIGVTGELLEVAARALARHPPRAFDAVQLASAELARSADPGMTAFASFDETLSNAARAEGFTLVS